MIVLFVFGTMNEGGGGGAPAAPPLWARCQNRPLYDKSEITCIAQHATGRLPKRPSICLSVCLSYFQPFFKMSYSYYHSVRINEQ